MKAKVKKRKRNARIDTESFMQRFIVAIFLPKME